MYLTHEPNQREVVQDRSARGLSLEPNFPADLPQSEPFIFSISDKDYSGIHQPTDQPLVNSSSYHLSPKKPNCDG